MEGCRIMQNRRQSRRAPFSRRQFLELSATAALAGFAEAALHGQARDLTARDVDLVVWNAKVHTVDAAMPEAQAFAVKAGRFVAVGSSAEIKSLASKRTQSFDAKGMTIPGQGAPNVGVCLQSDEKGFLDLLQHRLTGD